MFILTKEEGGIGSVNVEIGSGITSVEAYWHFQRCRALGESKTLVVLAQIKL